MSVSNKAVVQWFYDRQGKLTYSMTGSRNGTDGTADCSGSITQAVRDAGGVAYDKLYSTVTLSGYLAKNGYKRISANQEWDAKMGDIVLMSWGDPQYGMGASAGAGGHVGVMEDENNFISTDYWTGGQYGTAVSRHDFNNYFNINVPTYFEVWRIQSGTNIEEPSKPAVPQPQPEPQNDVDYMRKYGFVQWNGVVINVDDRSNYAGIWQVISNNLSGLTPSPTTSDIEWRNNGIPMAGINWADGTSNNSVFGNNFKFANDVMAIVDYDVASNGIAVLVSGFKVWVDATFAKNA